MPTLDQWRRTWLALGVASPDEALFHELLRRYSEPHRKYHDARHLDECLALLPGLRPAAIRAAEIELALWFHDAIYDLRAQGNEARSADWARTACLQAGLSSEVADRIHGLVLATRHDTAPQEADAGIITDIDLAILGASPERFDEYERGIRQEYFWVPAQVFRRERRKILEGFLARPRIFSTEYCFRTLERPARENLQRSLDRAPPRPQGL